MFHVFCNLIVNQTLQKNTWINRKRVVGMHFAYLPCQSSRHVNIVFGERPIFPNPDNIHNLYPTRVTRTKAIQVLIVYIAVG